ncbi:MAG: metallopeptidase family protein [Tissierellia bacterium]|nr:metallopeptidase family protein [Tissierellia bacterium]
MEDFISIDRMHEILDEIAQDIPRDFYKGLSGGIVLLPDAKLHKEAVNDDLYIMGEYHRSRMGKYIKIYYGSFKKVYPYLDEANLKEKLRHTLIHEFTHHLEGLSGLKDLEVEDEIMINEYKSRFKD